MDAATTQDPHPPLVGAQAPDFALNDQHGAEVRLRAGDVGDGPAEPGRAGTAHTVVVFYPFAFTGVCTGELRVLQEAQPRFAALDARVLAISCDSMFSLRVFAERESLTFPLLSDFWPHGEVARHYGVFDADRGCALRGTFVIDRAGAVRWQVVNAIQDARAVDDYLTALERL
ncbi:peroxiredoxin [Actinopolymorpha rutila]|uniref:Alkyl hydroperoxide reductase E n=1 Tax=Actinopolymorpha rutila TaxID=446787 RepID=A0A852ZAN7_9ACTN|nr:peroxiredoxin [Actinopolymorpha rutila]